MGMGASVPIRQKRYSKLIFIATILDPWEKFDIMEFAFCKWYNDENGSTLLKGVKDAIFDLFGNDNRLVLPMHDNGGSNVHMVDESFVVGLGQRKCRWLFKEEYLKKKKEMEGTCEKRKIELDLYLIEAIIGDSDDFDILRWWRLNAERFPILSKLTKDVLSVLISTMASKAVFSIGGRVLDAFRSFLTPRMTQCLICYQDWLRSGIAINTEKDLEEVENFKTIGEIDHNDELESNISLDED